ncbi:MAG: hypothetical protein KTR28_01600 [Micavibrio sp.]|nr:hypothetical protein [Micavibrio sp.]
MDQNQVDGYVKRAERYVRHRKIMRDAMSQVNQAGKVSSCYLNFSRLGNGGGLTNAFNSLCEQGKQAYIPDNLIFDAKPVGKETADLIAEGQQAETKSLRAQDQHIACELAALFSGKQAALNRNAAQVSSGAALCTSDRGVSISDVTANMCRGNHI